MTMSPGFYFKNFQSTDGFESHANASLSRIMDIAPYGATISACISKHEGHYAGHIEICSKWGPFFVSAIGEGPEAVLDRLIRKMRGKLETWHDRRFKVTRSEGISLAQ